MYSVDDIIGECESIKAIKNLIKKISNSNSPVFVYGDTGTGKELIVQAIHNSSNRSKKPFVVQNCAAIPENLLESIFFGVTRGAFTGAVENQGLFELANGGTLYLDELNSMDIAFQGKFLRVLQEGAVRRIGSNDLTKLDVRVIASVNEIPEILIEEGRLRKDLFYRLNVIRIDIPNLDNRKEDIPILIDHFIDKFNHKFNTAIIGVEKLALMDLIMRDYDGNIRELEHIIEGAFNYKSEGYLTLKDMDLERVEMGTKSLKKKLEIYEIKCIKEALILSDYNVSKAADFLMLPRQTLQYKIGKYKIK